MVEEVFNTKSNSQIYINDHLTPYFNKLYLHARNAKKEGKLASVNSYGGKIRVSINKDDTPISIQCERQLQTLIDTDMANNSSDACQRADNTMDNSHYTSILSLEEASTSTSYTSYKHTNKKNAKGNNHTNQRTTRTAQRKADTQATAPRIEQTKNKTQ